MRTTIILASLIVLVIALASCVDAHKSVRHHKPKTEEAREAHHHHKWATHTGHVEHDDAHFIANQRSEYDALDHSHKSHHRRWGPSFPNHLKHKNWHYDPPQFVNGAQVDHAIDKQDYHLFGLSPNKEF